MKKMLVSLIAGLLLLAPLDGLAQEQAEAPIYKDGDFWHFRVVERDFITRSSAALGGDYEVAYSEDKLKVFQLTGDQKVEVATEEADELKRMLGIGQDDTQYLQFPLLVRKKWTASYTRTIRGLRRPSSRTAETSVTGIEEIATPAGIFKAFKIERDDSASFPQGSRQAFILFYSPQTRSIVKYYMDASVGTGSAKREIELIKFGSVR